MAIYPIINLLEEPTLRRASLMAERLDAYGVRFLPISSNAILDPPPTHLEALFRTVRDLVLIALHTLLPNYVEDVYAANQQRMHEVEKDYKSTIKILSRFVLDNLPGDGCLNTAHQATLETAKRIYLTYLRGIGTSPSLLQKWTGAHFSKDFYLKHMPELTSGLQSSLQQTGPTYVPTDERLPAIILLANNPIFSKQLNLNWLSQHTPNLPPETLFHLLTQRPGIIHGLNELDAGQARMLLTHKELIERMSCDQLDRVIRIGAHEAGANYPVLVQNALNYFPQLLTAAFADNLTVTTLALGTTREEALVDHNPSLMARFTPQLVQRLLDLDTFSRRQLTELLNYCPSLLKIRPSADMMRHIVIQAPHLLSRFSKQTVLAHETNIYAGREEDLPIRRDLFATALATATAA